MHSQAAELIRLMNHPIKFRYFLFLKLPSAFFSGVRIIRLDVEKCSVKVPYGWFTKNPFQSTYFACLSMAAEMSTGVLALAHIHKRNPSISMLVTKMEALYFKKARSVTIFTCDQGKQILECIEDAVEMNQGRNITVKSTGLDPEGEKVAEFFITWSFKPRTNPEGTGRKNHAKTN